MILKYSRPRHLFKIITAVAIVAAIVGVCAFLWSRSHTQQKPEISTEILKTGQKGKIVQGVNLGGTGQLTTTKDKVVFESDEVTSKSKTANAVVVNWVDTRGTNPDAASNGDIEIEVRTRSNGTWSDWVRGDSEEEDRKDGSTAINRSLVLGDSIERVQYRIAVIAGIKTAPTVDLKETQLEIIDASRGPQMPSRQNPIERAVSAIFKGETAAAKADGPRVYQREEWGGWENPSIGWYPNASPNWPEQYEPLHQIIVHHTASTANGDSFAAMRALWQFHANGNGWGDIGYNYVVDPWGNTFKGRHYVEADARAQGGDVVAGHAYDHNRGTSGISVIGTYISSSPTPDAFYAVARIAAFKALPYKFNPSELSYLIGHRDATSTGCPGQQFYERLPEVRGLADAYYRQYALMDSMDASYRNQRSYSVMWPNTVAPAHIDIKNEGTETWFNSGYGATILSSDRPRGKNSAFCASSWIDCTKVGSFSERVVSSNPDGTDSTVAASTIKPGEVARFKFDMQSPQGGGFYREFFSLQSKDRAWFIRDLGMYFELNVPQPQYSWKMNEQFIYTNPERTIVADTQNLSKNTIYYARIKAYNSGNQPWYRDGLYPVRFATSKPQDRHSPICDSTWIYADCNRPAGLVEAKIDPMSVGTFDFQIKTPATPGTLRENFNLMVERKGPMSGENQYWDLKINP